METAHKFDMPDSFGRLLLYYQNQIFEPNRVDGRASVKLVWVARSNNLKEGIWNLPKENIAKSFRPRKPLKVPFIILKDDCVYGSLASTLAEINPCVETWVLFLI